MRFPEDRLVTDAATLQLARQALKDHAWATRTKGSCAPVPNNPALSPRVGRSW